MADLFSNPDGANGQAQAVLAYLRTRDGIEASWSKETLGYAAQPSVDRWYNCREQGYVISLRSANYARQLNIAFFEHRNSDSICALEWEQITTAGNPPTIDSMPESAYPDKWHASHTESVGKASQMADWIFERLNAFWKSANEQKKSA